MSVQIEALAGEVFQAAGVMQRAGAVLARRPFGEVVTNPDYPDVFFLNFLADLYAPEWMAADLEAALLVESPRLRHYRASSRNRETCDRLDPRLQGAGYQPEHKLGMVLVREPAVRGAQVRIEPATSPVLWPAAERLIRSEWEGWL